MRELSVLDYHPETIHAKRKHQIFQQNDEFSRIHTHAEQAMIGEYINLQIAPAVLYITIRKGVQESAIRILVRQIYNHIQTGVSRILVKHTKKGNFIYKQWLSSKLLKSISEIELYKRFIDITNAGKRTVTVIIRQNIAKGNIQQLWSQNHSLLLDK